LQRLQNGILHTIGNFPRNTSVRGMSVALQVPYVYDYITQAELIHNHENENVRYIGQGDSPHRKYKKLKLGGAMCTTVQVSRTTAAA
jgi:hypothetical protein